MLNIGAARPKTSFPFTKGCSFSCLTVENKIYGVTGFFWTILLGSPSSLSSPEYSLWFSIAMPSSLWWSFGSLGRCVFSWADRFELWVNRLKQFGKLQTYGFSPVCVRKWVLRLKSRLKRLLQTSHLYGFSPVWTSWCLLSFELSKNFLLHPST